MPLTAASLAQKGGEWWALYALGTLASLVLWAIVLLKQQRIAAGVAVAPDGAAAPGAAAMPGAGAMLARLNAVADDAVASARRLGHEPTVSRLMSLDGPAEQQDAA